MEIQNLKLAYFSPTGTTKTIVERLAENFQPHPIECIDITNPKARTASLFADADDLLVVAVPVYMGRVPAVIHDWLCSIRADETLAVGLAVYGNRAYGDALLELSHIISSCGGIPLACAAFIGEHSFSNTQNSTAQGRPDSHDLRRVDDFCQGLKSMIGSYTSAKEAPSLRLPGKFPYEGDTKLWDVDFIEVSGACAKCGLCAGICPVGAIEPGESGHVDIEKCLTCCACIKACPQSARTVKDSPVQDASVRLYTLYSERKEPEFYFAEVSAPLAATFEKVKHEFP